MRRSALEVSLKRRQDLPKPQHSVSTARHGCTSYPSPTLYLFVTSVPLFETAQFHTHYALLTLTPTHSHAHIHTHVHAPNAHKRVAKHLQGHLPSWFSRRDDGGAHSHGEQVGNHPIPTTVFWGSKRNKVQITQSHKIYQPKKSHGIDICNLVFVDVRESIFGIGGVTPTDEKKAPV